MSRHLSDMQRLQRFFEFGDEIVFNLCDNVSLYLFKTPAFAEMSVSVNTYRRNQGYRTLRLCLKWTLLLIRFFVKRHQIPVLGSFPDELRDFKTLRNFQTVHPNNDLLHSQSPVCCGF